MRREDGESGRKCRWNGRVEDPEGASVNGRKGKNEGLPSCKLFPHDSICISGDDESTGACGEARRDLQRGEGGSGNMIGTVHSHNASTRSVSSCAILHVKRC